jgi:hypothetical protein
MFSGFTGELLSLFYWYLLKRILRLSYVVIVQSLIWQVLKDMSKLFDSGSDEQSI